MNKEKLGKQVLSPVPKRLRREEKRTEEKRREERVKF